MNLPGFARSAAGGVALLAILVAARAQTPAEPPPAEAPPTPREPVSVVWSRQVPRVVDLAVSGDGRRVISLTQVGDVTCWDERGERRWRHRFPHVDSLAISTDGSVCLAYTRLSAVHRTVFFMRDDGSWFATLAMDAPIRCALIRRDGAYAALAVGPAVVLCQLGDGQVHSRVTHPPGVPTWMQFATGADLYVACTLPDQVLLLRGDGAVEWTYSRQGAARYSLSASQDGTTLAVGGELPTGIIEVAYLDLRGRRLWSFTRPGRGPRVRLSALGAAVLLSYEHLVTYSGEQRSGRFERRLAYFSRDVRPSWTKGGVFSAPLCVAVDAEGRWVLSLDIQYEMGTPRFRLLGREEGQRLWLHTSPARVLIASSSALGGHTAIYRADETIDLLAVEAP